MRATYLETTGVARMLLLGRDWMEFAINAEAHVTEVWWSSEHSLWWWSCTCERHEGYGNVKDRIVAAAQRHARTFT